MDLKSEVQHDVTGIDLCQCDECDLEVHKEKIGAHKWLYHRSGSTITDHYMKCCLADIDPLSPCMDMIVCNFLHLMSESYSSDALESVKRALSPSLENEVDMETIRQSSFCSMIATMEDDIDSRRCKTMFIYMVEYCVEPSDCIFQGPEDRIWEHIEQHVSLFLRCYDGLD